MTGRLSPRLFSASVLLLLALLSLALPGRIQLLRARNAASADLAGQVVKMTTGFEQDAVFLSYVYNDQIIYYTGRSVLNYRRIPPSDQVARRYHWEWLGPCMNAMVAELIDDGTAVYYVKDQSPSFVNSLESLQAQFELEEVGTDPPIYRLEKDGSTSQIQEANQCPPSIYN